MSKADLINEAAKALGSIKDSKTLVDGVFSPFDDALETADDSEKNKLIDLLNQAEKKVEKIGGKNRDWWMSEVYLRKGRCAKGIFKTEKEYPFWKQAYDYARKSGNNEVIIQSGLSLGFEFVQFTTSIREILEIQMNCIKAVCAQGAAIHTRLRIMGVNLFSFWHQLEYRRLSEHDLKAKQLVIDGAKSLEKAGFDDDMAAPIMILLISKAYDFDDPSLEWAKHEAAVLDPQVPETIKTKIESYKLKGPRTVFNDK